MTIRDRIDHSVTLLSGMALGAALMYIMDPNRGAARRAHARDKVVRGTRVLGRNLNKQGRNIVNHAIGSVADVGSGIRDRFRDIDDDVLTERVRAQIGHVVSHPRLVEVTVRNGRATITGDVLEGEREKIANVLSKTRGVRGFNLQLQLHSSSDLEGLAGLRGGRRIQAI